MNSSFLPSVWMPHIDPGSFRNLESFLIPSLALTSLFITPSFCDYITKFKFGWIDHPFLFSYIAFPLITSPSHLAWILLLFLPWFPCHFDLCRWPSNCIRLTKLPHLSKYFGLDSSQSELLFYALVPNFHTSITLFTYNGLLIYLPYCLIDID